jgi:farnesyl-diphosphate farnesyltransferase
MRAEPMTAPAPDLNELLHGVSRSFYLSIRLLPGRLRAPVGLAYLMARAADTVADTTALAADRRLAMLERLEAAFAIGRLDAGLAADLPEFAAAAAQPQESALLRRLPQCFGPWAALDEADRADVQAVLARIVRGQALDLQRFPGPAAPQAVPDAAALNEYAYLVAGCVGEFWTDLCQRHIDGYARLPHQQMRALGRSFGIGLQLVNIVRDAGEDLAAGRCYFPADELAAAGLEPGTITAQPGRFLPLWQHWQDGAMRHLRDGMEYAIAVNPRRVRAGVALPALIGQRTLLRLRAAGPQALGLRVKVPRREVHALLARLAFTWASRRALQAEWDNRAR